MFGFGDVFSSGSRQRKTRPQRGEDVRYDLDISFEDSMHGLAVDIQVPRMEECARCKGKGAEPEDGVVTCPMCRGRGEVIYQQAFLSVRRTCSQCNGRGQIIRRPCKECRGQGYLRRERKLKVNIPAGVDNGTQLRLSQEGQPGVNGGPRWRSVRGSEGRRASHLRAARVRPALHCSGEYRASARWDARWTF